MNKVCIRGNGKHPEKVIEFLGLIESIFNPYKCEKDKILYHTDGLEIFANYTVMDGYTEISFADACAILDGKAILNDDCTVTYKENKELPHFPCEMWVWDDDVNDAELSEVHGHIPTICYPWIDKDNCYWKNASLTDPRIEETITIKEAEKLLGKKIRR